MYEIEVVRKSDNIHIVYTGFNYKDSIKGTDYEAHPDDYIFWGDRYDDTAEKELWKAISY